MMDAITTQAKNNCFTKDERERRECCDINKDFFHNRQAKYLQLLTHEQLPVTINLTKPITKKRATMLYQNHLVRTITGPAISVAALDRLYAEVDIDSVMLKVDRIAELTGTALVLPYPTISQEGMSSIRLLIYDGSLISVLPDEDDPEKAAAITIIKKIDRILNNGIYGQAGYESIIRMQIWTDTAVVTYEGDKLIKSETNELGFIPIARFLGEEVENQYLGEAPITGVRMLNASINQMVTDLGYTIKMQTASPVALEGYQSGEQITLHPGRAFSLPMGAKATILDFNPKIKDALEAIGYLEEKVYETSSVPKVCIVGGEGTSGRELLVRWFPLTQVFEEKSVRYQKYEFNLANMILAVQGLPPIKDLQIDFPDDANLPLSASEDTLKEDIALNITTPALEVMRRNPEMNLAEAQLFVLQNMAFNKQTSPPRIDTTPPAV